MLAIKYKDWTLLVDVSATEQFYDSLEVGSAKACGCHNCQNFLATVPEVYPKEMRTLLAKLGVDYLKDSELCYIANHEDGYWYSGLFFYAGTLLGKESRVQFDHRSSTVEMIDMTNNFSIGFCRTGVQIIRDNQTFIQIEFMVELPWVIDKDLAMD